MQVRGDAGVDGGHARRARQPVAADALHAPFSTEQRAPGVTLQGEEASSIREKHFTGWPYWA